MPETIVKKDLAGAIYELGIEGVTRADALRLVEETFQEIADAIDDEGTLKLRDFGTFYIRRKPARMGRNPKTKEPAIISARRTLYFDPSPKMRAAVNGETLARAIAAE